MENETQNLLEYENRQLKAILEAHGIRYKLDDGTTLPNDSFLTINQITERTLRALEKGLADAQG